MKMEGCLWVIILASVALTNQQGVRLVNSGHRCSGKLEQYATNRKGIAKWLAVCPDDWDLRDAEVVCRELGCGDAVEALKGNHFGQRGGYWHVKFACDGSESSLAGCPLYEQSCSPGYAEVICSGVTLVGPSHCSGRVELLHKETRHTVCDAAFDWQDAEVVCRGLDCGAPVEVLGAAAFGEGEGQVWSEEIRCGGHETQIQLCPTSPILSHRCSHKNDAGLTCGDAVRLVGGSGRCSGRVEVLHSGQWGTVCDNGWDLHDAAVVCRELGCGEAIEALKGSQFGQGAGGIWMSDVQCVGSEPRLKDCKSKKWEAENCGHHQDAGVICSGVKLVGPSHCSGRVELLHKETRHTLCNAAFDWQDAEVVCRELDCGAPVEVLGAAAFGEGEGQVWSEEIQCGGNETQIQLCPKSALNHSCSHENDVGLTCEDAVRLVNGSSRCSGRVEVVHRGQWGTVCDNGLDLRDAAVVCRELGCGEAVEALKGAQFGQGAGRIWMSDVECVGSESRVKDCNRQKWGAENCGHHQDAGVICSGVTLVGPSHCSGRVELLHKETRHTVCDAAFDWQDAEVLCRELDCGAPVEVLRAAAFGEGEGQVWSEEIQCGGNETHIHLCPTSTIPSYNCSHKHDVGLACTDPVKLVDGGSRCSGRVEVYYKGQWGTVCDAYWGQDDTAVVCKELGCGDAVDSLSDAHFGEGPGRVVMADVGCVGVETSLKNCSHKGLGEHTCEPHDNVGVICSGHRAPRLVNGSHRCSGRVEVEHGSIWGTVCNATFDWQDAEVVCRELGCGLPVKVLGAADFGKGKDQVWSEEIQCGGNETHIQLCPTSPLKFNCSHDMDVGIVCSGYTDARLANGSDTCSGRVELKYLSKWGTVCDASWDMRASSALCHQLKCGRAVAVVGAEWFGEGSGSIWPDVFDCEGNETGLSECGISSWRRPACSHRQDAGVICSNSSFSLPNGMVRLSGERKCEGAVEVYVSQRWRRVLLDSWNQSEASVVCRQLACGSAVGFSGSIDTEGDECVSGIRCSGHETHLGNCSAPQILNCTSSQQVTISCSGHQPVRLTGSGGDCAGRLEVFHNGLWGTVCDDSWDMEDAQVVCRQLQCGTALSAEVPTSFPPGDLPIWLSEVGCRGDESSLWECILKDWGQHDCLHKEDVWVMCSGFIQLKQTTDSRGPCKGLIDIYYNGTWGNLCFSDMYKNTDSMICHQLGCGEHKKTIDKTPTKATRLSLPHCRKHDTHLEQCRPLKWETTCRTVADIECEDQGSETNTTTIQKDWVKECPGAQKLRLVGGSTKCSGRVEVHLQGEWGTVCDDSWDKSDAQVVCRQLDCGEPKAVGGEQGTFGRGSGPIWLDEVNCTGHEDHLWECCRAPLDQSDCIHKEDAWVNCTGPPPPPTPHPPVTSVRTKVPPCEPVSPAAAAALGLLFLLLLGSLAVLVGQNRSLRRALSKRRHMALSEAVYEELDHRLTRASSSTRRQRARILSDGQNSWYEDVQEDERRPISAVSLREPAAEYYDDATADDETRLGDMLTDIGALLFGSGETKTDVQSEDYDDVDDVTSGEKSSEVTDYIDNTGYDDVGESDETLISESVREEGLEYYDDITTDENDPEMTRVDKTNHANKEQEDYDDVGNKEDDLQMTAGKTANHPQQYNGVIAGTDYDDVGAESRE